MRFKVGDRLRNLVQNGAYIDIVGINQSGIKYRANGTRYGDIAWSHLKDWINRPENRVTNETENRERGNLT